MDLSSTTLIQNIFACYEPQLKSKPLPLKHLKAIDAIITCRTPERGVSVFECEEDQSLTCINHPCRHRSCTLCAQRRQHQWLDTQKKRLLNCPHFHVVFTLPHEYLTLWQYNQHWFIKTFFRVVRATLIDLMHQRHGVTPGILMAMHTWGRQLSLHPHIHCVITGGGLDHQHQWKHTGQYLLPVKQLKALYRGRFQSQIKTALLSGELVLPPNTTPTDIRRTLRKSYAKEWSVRIEPQYAHGLGVLNYLSRYLKGGPLKPQQIVRCDAQCIAFRYKDHREKRTKVLQLKPQEFVRRILLHVPEIGQHMVRHYGLYASAGRRKRNQCREQIGGLMEAHPDTESGVKKLSCPRCGSRLRWVWTIEGRRKKGNSYNEPFTRPFVQPDDETDTAETKKRSLQLRL